MGLKPCGEAQCYVLESYPKDKYSGYTRLVSWINQAELRTEKVEFYDRKKSLLKVMTIQKYEKFDDKYWRPLVSLMENKQTGKSTEMHWTGIRLKTGLSEEDFSKNNLKRAK